MNSSATPKRHWQQLIYLRWPLISVEILLLILWADNNPLPWLCWFALVAQLFQQVLSLVWINFVRRLNHTAVAGQLLLDVLLLTCLLYATGGATNAYVSALLLPIALAGVMLSGWQVALVLAAAIVAYSSMVFWLPLEIHHIHDMQSHFVGMWINFMLSALVVAFVVAAIARELRQRDAQLAQQQLTALGQQQLLAMGTAAAQTVHDMATPVASLGLLQEELAEQYPDHPDVLAMSAPLEQCQQSLAGLRQQAADIRQHKSQPITVAKLTKQLLERSQLMWPEVNWHLKQSPSSQADNWSLQADTSLLPALLNIMQNAADACVPQQNSVMIRSELKATDGGRSWHLTVENQFDGQLQDANMAGEQLVSSEHGFGMALLLSRTVIERFSGSLLSTKLTGDPAIMQVIVQLPVAESEHG